MRATVLIVLAALGAAECERTPPEDFASRTSTPVARAGPRDPPATSSAAGPSALAGRCVRPTPATPPPVSPGPAAACPPDPEGGPRKLPIVRVSFPDAHGAVVDAELVRSEHDTERGLMYRKSLAEERGMLFDLRVRGDHPFWMHNTCIPLDLIYVDEDGLIVGIVENAPTLDDTSRDVGCPSRYVLEVNAGWCRRHGVKAGQRMTIPDEARDVADQ
jgi:uncharacterized membrane protein (UPF0127 family)